MRYYVCIENGSVVSVVDYEPNVPPTVRLVEINEEDFKNLKSTEYRFDTTLEKVVKFEKEYIENNSKREKNIELLYSTDWMILRHLRETTLGIETSLTKEEYLDLEKKRQEAAKNI